MFTPPPPRGFAEIELVFNLLKIRFKGIYLFGGAEGKTGFFPPPPPGDFAEYESISIVIILSLE